MHDYKSIEKNLTSLTNYFAEHALHDGRFQEVRELIEQHGEYGEAYHLLCYLIMQNQLTIPNDIYQTIVELGKQMEVDETAWLTLTALIKTYGQNEMDQDRTRGNQIHYVRNTITGALDDFKFTR
ncbi:MAG TPA: hypothetical protein VE863_22325 [Pyrinomonadaceae bacterium]|jgi:hypothetical protein|nr:hypothetical protein [Pyrinomonadaceae bacterium]